MRQYWHSVRHLFLCPGGGGAAAMKTRRPAAVLRIPWDGGWPVGSQQEACIVGWGLTANPSVICVRLSAVCMHTALFTHTAHTPAAHTGSHLRTGPGDPPLYVRVEGAEKSARTSLCAHVCKLSLMRVGGRKGVRTSLYIISHTLSSELKLEHNLSLSTTAQAVEKERKEKRT